MSESNTKQMIQLNHVKFGYSDTEVLEEINLTIHEGEYVVLTGENGSGKSTLMRLILGEMKPDEGEIILMNNDPRLKKRIGYVFTYFCGSSYANICGDGFFFMMTNGVTGTLIVVSYKCTVTLYWA